MNFIFLLLLCSAALTAGEPAWKSNYAQPDFFEASPTSEENSVIDPFSDEVSGYLIELHHEQNASLVNRAKRSVMEYASERNIPLENIISGNTSVIFYLKKVPTTDSELFYDQFGKIVSWFMLNRQDSVVSLRPIFRDQSTQPFDPDRVIWMEPIVARKGMRTFRDPESTIVDGFHIHVDYLPGQETQAASLKEAYRKSAVQKGILYSAFDDYPEKANGPHVRAGWEVKFEKAGATVFDRFGYSLAWLLINHQDIPVYSHSKTWIYGENEERLISHLDNALYIGTPPDLNQWFFFNPEVNPSGLFRWDSHLPLSRKMTPEASQNKQQQILQFWFGEEPGDYPFAHSRLWFSKQREARDADFDKLILDTFQKDLVLATTRIYNPWEATPKGRLALIVLLDQFPRNMFRGTPMAFAYDRLSLAIAKRGIEAGDDKKLSYAERLFFYLPFSHSENLADQIQGVALQAQLKDEVPASLKEIFAMHHHMAELHCKTVEKFGRLSSRNAILGRDSTPEEEAFLKNPEHHF